MVGQVIGNIQKAYFFTLTSIKKVNFMKNKITKDKMYNGYKINNGINRDFSCYTKTLDQVIDVAEYTVAYHSKSLFVRLDIRGPDEGGKRLSRKDMTRVIENVQRNLNRKCIGTNAADMNVVWTTENEDKSPHYHLFIGVNGNAIQNGYRILHEMNDAVMKKLDTKNPGLVEFSKSNGKFGIRVDRQSSTRHQDIEKAIYAGSYLAKIKTKENKPKGARVSSSSKLPVKWRSNSKQQNLFEDKN